MNWDQIEGKRKQLAGSARKHWILNEGLRKSMLQVFTHLMKWISIPVLMAASLFSYTAARYEPLLLAAVIVGAIAFVQQAVRSRQYFWAAGLVAIVVAFSPLFFVTKIFLVMGLICFATLAALIAAFQTQPVPLV